MDIDFQLSAKMFDLTPEEAGEFERFSVITVEETRSDLQDILETQENRMANLIEELKVDEVCQE